MNAQIDLCDEIIIDGFAGGGGWSTGIEIATGAPVDIAINHDPAAVLMHKTNHPFTEHFCESIYDVDPIKACKGRPVGWAHFSPDCKHFSKAKGGKPVEKKIRGLAWVVLRWAGLAVVKTGNPPVEGLSNQAISQSEMEANAEKLARPRIISLENVEEFKTWGPVKRGKPIKSRKGETFKKFVAQLEALGYVVEFKELRASDYGAPTIRKRFFLIARCDGKPIVWPKPTHGAPNSEGVLNGKLLPYKTAADCIDFSLPCKSIFNRKKPLADNTMQRIARGADKFVLKNNEPFIVQVNHGGDGFRGQSITEPLQTVTAKHGYGVVAPYMVPIGYGERKGQAPRVNDITEPLSTIVSSCKQYLAAPSLIQYHNEQAHGEVRGQKISEPLLTVDTQPRYALNISYIQKYNTGDGHASKMQEPLHTLTTKDRMSIVESHLCILRNNMDCKSLKEPFNTVTTSGAHMAEIRTYMVKYDSFVNLQNWPQVREMLNRHCGYTMADDEVLIIEIDNIAYFIADIGLRMLEPKELYKAMGFPADYIIDHDYTGKAYPKNKQVARCGNAVPPPFATALVRANWPERCKGLNITDMAQLAAHMTA